MILGYTDWLNEDFQDDFPKNKYVELDKKDAVEYAQDILDLISTAYSRKGGNLEFKTVDDIKNSDLTYWVLKDLDADPNADVLVGGKKTDHGTKITVMGQDGSPKAKTDVVGRVSSLLKSRGFYAEFDKDLAQKMGLKHVQDEKTIRQVLNKEITYNNDGSYERDIHGHRHTKVLVGFPK
jgi:hypothetical protein